MTLRLAFLSPALLALLLACTVRAGQALAQPAPAYRCGNSYQAKPCAGGVAVDTDDARSDAQRRQAEAVRQRDATLARQMAADRRSAERDAARQGGPANVGPREPPAAKTAGETAAKKNTGKKKGTSAQGVKAPKPPKPPKPPKQTNAPKPAPAASSK